VHYSFLTDSNLLSLNFQTVAAQKQIFLENASRSEIIHLATHADAGSKPWIAFSNEKLAIGELYTFKNEADLVVLSACNTTIGDIVEGEGVLSLARGFFYKGSNSVISTLWNINDKSAIEITDYFYSNISDGMTKSRALRQAKMKYLSEQSLPDISPYYWASYILIGDSNKVPSFNRRFSSR